MSEFQPEQYPAFPSGLPTIPIPALSLRKLEKDENERTKLFEACKDRGFFYLSFEDTEAEKLVEFSEKLAVLGENIFKLPLEEKINYRWKDGSIMGYKGTGEAIVDTKNTPDRSEIFNISKDNIISEQFRAEPQVVLDDKEFLAEYIRVAHLVGMKILSILADKLGLPLSVFEDIHKLSRPSGDHVRITRAPSRRTDQIEAQIPSHTDFGTITILFNWLGGLQLWSNSSRGGEENVVEQASGEWLWVKPKKGHAIINLGDAAVKFTGGLFCAGRHRVVNAPGEQGKYPRFSVVYFVRPADDEVMRTFQAPGIPYNPEADGEQQYTVKEWIVKQAKTLGIGRD